MCSSALEKGKGQDPGKDSDSPESPQQGGGEPGTRPLLLCLPARVQADPEDIRDASPQLCPGGTSLSRHSILF